MSYNIFHVIHLVLVFLFFALSFSAFASPMPEKRKRYLAWSGALFLGVLLTGFGLLGILKAGVPVWSLVKLACGVVISITTGLAFRNRERISIYKAATVLAMVIAVVMVSYKP